jgi:hypothetical protein
MFKEIEYGGGVARREGTREEGWILQAGYILLCSYALAKSKGTFLRLGSLKKKSEKRKKKH